MPQQSQIFMLLDTVQSDNKNCSDKLFNDFDTEFKAPEEIELTGNPDNVIALALEVNVNVVDQETTHTYELKANKRRKKPEENAAIT